MKKYNLIPVLLSSSLLLTSGTLFPCEVYAEAQVLSDVSTDDTREEKKLYLQHARSGHRHSRRFRHVRL